MANNEQQRPTISEPSEERKSILEAAYVAQKDTDAPYKGVEIGTLDELKWIFVQRNWSCEWPLPEGMSPVNLSGANLNNANLSGANLYRANLSDAVLHGANLSGANLNNANLSGASLVSANLSGAWFYQANLSGASLMFADLSGGSLESSDLSGGSLVQANLSGVSLLSANLSGASLMSANLSGASLVHTNLSGASLRGSDLSGASLVNANLSGTSLQGVTCDEKTTLDGMLLDMHTKVGDIRWNGVPLLRVDWNPLMQGQELRLGDEADILEPVTEGLKQRTPTHQERIERTEIVERAYIGLARELKDQNLTDSASAARLCYKRLNRRVMFMRRKLAGGIGSWLLDLVSGYGEIPQRTFIAYGIVVVFFSLLDFLVTNTIGVGANVNHLSWDESLVLSLTSFHGRGFFPGYLQLNDWVARIAAVEAVIGLFIELILIATFSRRFLGD